MSVKHFHTRIIQKNDSVANFTAGNSPIVPMKGEIVVGWESSATNTSQDPFILKIGDGASTWANLPEIGPEVYNQVSCTSSASGGSTVVSAVFKPYKKMMATYSMTDSDAYSFSISATGASGKIASAEHCFLIDNSGSAYDREFTGASIAGIDSANMKVQTAWLSSGDTMLISIRVFYVGSIPHAVVTTETGFVNAGYLN